MLVVLHASQLEHIIEKVLIKNFTLSPRDLRVDNRYYVKAQNDWEVSAHFINEGKSCRVDLNIDPETGKVKRCALAGPSVA